MRDRLAKEWPPIPPRRGIQSIDARRTSSQQHQFQELSQPQNSRTNELNCPLRHLHPRSNNNDDDSPTMMMRGGWRRNPLRKNCVEILDPTQSPNRNIASGNSSAHTFP